jgi:hypothetical protein
MISTSSKKFKDIIAKDCIDISKFARENEELISKAAWNEIERKCNKSKNRILGISTVECPDVPSILKGATYLLASGETFEAKGTLKSAGGKWVPDLGGWVYPVDLCKDLQGKLDIKDVKISPRSAVALVNVDDVKKSIRASFDPRFHAALGRFMGIESAGLPSIDAEKVAKRTRDKVVAIAGMDAPDDQLVGMIAGDAMKRAMFWKSIDESSVPSIIPADPGKALEMLSSKTAIMADCPLFPSKEDPENRKCTIVASLIETTNS